MDAVEAMARLAEIAEKTDKEYGDGDSPNGWLSFAPTVNDEQLETFGEMLDLGIQWAKDMTDCGHEKCAMRGLSETPFNSLVPPSTMLVLIRELQMHRTINAMELGELEFPDSL